MFGLAFVEVELSWILSTSSAPGPFLFLFLFATFSSFFWMNLPHLVLPTLLIRCKFWILVFLWMRSFRIFSIFCSSIEAGSIFPFTCFVTISFALYRSFQHCFLLLLIACVRAIFFMCFSKNPQCLELFI